MDESQPNITSPDLNSLQETPKKSKLWIILIIVALILLVAIYFGFNYFSKSQSTKDNEILIRTQVLERELTEIYGSSFQKLCGVNNSLPALDNLKNVTESTKMTVTNIEATVYLLKWSRDNCKNYSRNESLCLEAESILSKRKNEECNLLTIEKKLIEKNIQDLNYTKDYLQGYIGGSRIMYLGWRIMLDMGGVGGVVGLEPLIYNGTPISQNYTIIDTKEKALEYYKSKREEFVLLKDREISEEKIRAQFLKPFIESYGEDYTKQHEKDFEEYFNYYKEIYIDRIFADCKDEMTIFENNLNNGQIFELAYSSRYLEMCKLSMENFFL